MIRGIERDLQALATREKATSQARFFKTGPGEYGEGDVFLGVTMPEQRAVAKKYSRLPLRDIKKLLESRVHEHRLTGLLILGEQFRKNPGRRKGILDFYLRNLSRVNNWDLVDSSAPQILGEYLAENPEKRTILYRLARSKDLWERRVAILATSALIRKGAFTDTLRIAELFLRDDQDLIHKAVGWMLREVGKKDQKALEAFLRKHAKRMPRTMLRYAIERFPREKRSLYLERKVRL